MSRSRALFLGAILICVSCTRAAKDEARPVPLAPAEPRVTEVPLAAPAKAEALNVTHVSPRGQQTEVPTQIVVMFDQPMIALGQVDPGQAPIRMETRADFRFHWLGTRIAVATPTSPLQYATRYEVTVPAGTRSTNGLVLASDVVAEFDTPRPAVDSARPWDGNEDCGPLQPFLLHVDQPVHAKALEQVVRFRPMTGKIKEIRGVVKTPTSAEIEALMSKWEVRRFSAEAAAGRLYLVRPDKPLPPGAPFVLAVGPGLVGRLGPLPSTVEKTFKYKTYGPLTVKVLPCPKDECPPENPWLARIQFSNAVSAREFDRRVRGKEVDEDAYDWNTREFAAIERPRPGRNYDVVIPADLADVHGQRLGKQVALRFAFGHFQPDFEDYVAGGVMEAQGPRLYPFGVTNVTRVLARAAIVPRDMAARAFVLAGSEPAKDEQYLGLKLSDYPITPPAGRDRSFNVPLDLAALVPADRAGLVFYTAGAEADGAPLKHASRGLVQVTDLGITAKTGEDSTVMWVTRLSDGRPVKGARVELRDDRDGMLWAGSTDVDGRAEGPGMNEVKAKLPPLPRPKAPAAGEDDDQESARDDDLRRVFVIAMNGDDTGVLRLSEAETVWPSQPEGSDSGPEWWDDRGESLDGEWRSVLVLDRDVYREGENVMFKGWVRKMTGRGPRPVPGGTATLQVFSPARGDEDSDERPPTSSIPVTFDEFGAFATRYALPVAARHGIWQVRVVMPGQEKASWWSIPREEFTVTFFQPPEFQVRTAFDRPEYTRDDKARASVSAAYYFGAAMAGAPYTYTFSFSRTGFTPPGWDGYVFDLPWYEKENPASDPSPEARAAANGRDELDEAGDGQRSMVLVPPVRATSMVTFEAEVQDTTGRTVAGRSVAIVHPAMFYLGLRQDTHFVDRGKTVTTSVVAVDPRGRPADLAEASIQVTRREYHTVRRKGVGGVFNVVSEPVDVPVQTTSVRLVAGKAAFEFTPAEVGLHRVRASATDERGNQVRSGLFFNVVGKGLAAWERFNDDRVDLVPDRAEYRPGQTARILVKSPFQKAMALVTVERQTVLWQKVVELSGNAAPIDIPISKEFMPNVSVAAVVVRGRIAEAAGDAREGEDPGAPAVRVGAVSLRVDPTENHLSVKVAPAASDVRPGQEVVVALEVRDGGGAPARSQVLVMAVDAAILDLTGYVLEDPFATFFAPVVASVRTGDSRNFIIRRREFGEKSTDPGGDGGGDMMRKDFVALAFYDPTVMTGQDGRAVVRFKAPDNLTRFRVMAVAASGEAMFGNGKGEFTVSRPLIVRPSLPPFAEAGDSFGMAVAVHGSKGVSGTANVTVEVSGALRLTGPGEAAVKVSETKPVETVFQVSAETPGEAVVSVKGVLGGEKDGVVLKVPVRRRGWTETVAVCGATSETAGETVIPPPGAARDAGGLRITAASTALAGMEQAGRYLVEYPYGCLEQRMSRVLPGVLLDSISSAFGFEGEKSARMWTLVAETLARLPEFQHSDGGFGFWPGGDGPSDPYLTAYTVLAASKAVERGHQVAPGVLTGAVAYLGKALRKPLDSRQSNKPRLGPDDSAFAAWVLAVRKAQVSDILGFLVAERKGMTRVGLGFLVAAMAESKTADPKALGDCIEELTASVAVKGDEAYLPAGGFPEWYGGLASGNVEATAAAVIALTGARPGHVLLPGLARHLLNLRRQGRWATTHENGMALLALTAYYRTKEETVPDFRVTPYLGRDPLATWAFAGRTTEVRQVEVPMSRVFEAGRAPMTMAMAGQGSLYWSMALTWSPAGPAEPRDQGVYMTREVLDLEDAKAVTALRRGRAAAVMLTLASATALDRLAIDIPVPAGLHPVNEAFEISSRALDARVDGLPYKGRDLVCDHSETRDDRVICYVDRLPAGIATFRFGARAIVPGRFAFPPAKASEMYHPETYGTTAGGFFNVE